RWGYKTDYEFGDFAGEHRNEYNRFLYDFTFPILKPLSQIHYSIKSDGQWGEDKVFKTSVDTCSEYFSFIAGGDSHAGDSENTNDRWKIISELIANKDIDFFIHLGDAVDDDDDWSQWKTYFEYGKKLTEKKIIFHTWGNHEYGSMALYNFILPENKKWYSFEQGNALFICLLSEQDFDVQYDWLLDKLKNTDKEWIIVYFHRPFFTRGSHKDEMNEQRTTWWKAFDDYGVDIVMSGHTHSYIRTTPINLNISDTSAVAEYGSEAGQGRLEFVSGGLGGKNSKPCDKWFTAEAYSGMHYIKFEINGAKLHFDAYSETGAVIDSLTIYSTSTYP
ncbi:MAG: metallophosphoesterase, partial [Bacteroidales bacterium]|nr:metallophosphoesterase [Bacteroidales bacterium]